MAKLTVHDQTQVKKASLSSLKPGDVFMFRNFYETPRVYYFMLDDARYTPLNGINVGKVYNASSAIGPIDHVTATLNVMGVD